MIVVVVVKWPNSPICTPKYKPAFPPLHLHDLSPPPKKTYVQSSNIVPDNNV